MQLWRPNAPVYVLIHIIPLRPALDFLVQGHSQNLVCEPVRHIVDIYVIASGRQAQYLGRASHCSLPVVGLDEQAHSQNGEAVAATHEARWDQSPVRCDQLPVRFFFRHRAHTDGSVRKGQAPLLTCWLSARLVRCVWEADFFLFCRHRFLALPQTNDMTNVASPLALTNLTHTTADEPNGRL